MPKPGTVAVANNPKATTEENYLDVNTHIIGVGASFHVPDRIRLFPEGVNFDIGGQVQIMPRTVVTRDATDPIGSLAYGGAVLAGGADFRFQQRVLKSP